MFPKVSWVQFTRCDLGKLDGSSGRGFFPFSADRDSTLETIASVIRRKHALQRKHTVSHARNQVAAGNDLLNTVRWNPRQGYVGGRNFCFPFALHKVNSKWVHPTGGQYDRLPKLRLIAGLNVIVDKNPFATSEVHFEGTGASDNDFVPSRVVRQKAPFPDNRKGFRRNGLTRPSMTKIKLKHRIDSFYLLVLFFLIRSFEVHAINAPVFRLLSHSRKVRIQIRQALTQLACRQMSQHRPRGTIPDLSGRAIKLLVNIKSHSGSIRTDTFLGLPFRHGRFD